MSRPLFSLLAIGWLGAAFVAAGCTPLDEICGVRTEPVVSQEGGEVRCLRSDECPRTDVVEVCITDGWPEEPCVRCRDTRCERVVPEHCR